MGTDGHRLKWKINAAFEFICVHRSPSVAIILLQALRAADHCGRGRRRTGGDVPDTRRHRGAHPDDARLFAEAAWPALRAAVADLSWLLGKAYAQPSALKLVGDRYRLDVRQRAAVARAACADG